MGDRIFHFSTQLSLSLSRYSTLALAHWMKGVKARACAITNKHSERSNVYVMYKAMTLMKLYERVVRCSRTG